MKLHLGCGSVHVHSYVNADIQALPGVELVCDARALPFPDRSLKIIYACALIEHLSRWEWEEAVQHWSDKLRPGGVLRLSTADFAACAGRYLMSGSLDGLYGLLIGGQRDSWDWHGMIFDFETMKAGMEAAGLENVRRYDWHTTIIGSLGIDDYSQAYLPHMDKINGQLMALNIEGTRP